MGSKKAIVKEGAEGGIRVVESSSGLTPAEVVEIIGKIGTKQGGKQVRCKLIEGPEKEKIMRRNVMGPIRKGDILMLRETEIEASPIRGRKG